MKRCPWAGTDPLMIRYHDEEWGTPVRDDRLLFEFLILEGAQAGLSWRTILNRREGYRRAFSDGASGIMAPEHIARFGERDVLRFMTDPGIIRNRRKIEGAIANARAVLVLHDEGRSLSELLWGFVNGAPVRNMWKTSAEVPVSTAESMAMSKELSRRGFRFVGPVICYAFMQAVGMVNDHLVSCFRHSGL